MTGFGSGRPCLHLPHLSGLWTGPIPAVLAAVVLMAGCAGPAPSVPPASSATPYPSTLGSAAPSGAVVEPQPTPTPEPSAWTAVQVTGLPRVATLVPTKGGQGGVARDTAFVLTSLDGRPATALAAGLVADPPIAFAVRASGSAAVIARPKAALASGTTYRISLRRPDGSIEASWVARTAAPLAITDSVPGDQATNVPLDTGIEVTFNQYGVTAAGLRSRFAISPATTGHFVVAGRSVAFVPDHPLRKGTLYTVTIRHGLPVDGTGVSLAADRVIRFETAASLRSQVRVWLGDALVDATPRERAALTVGIDVPEGSAEPRTVPATVHRLAGLDAAVAAWKAVTGSPDWTLASTRAAVATAGLPRVLSASLRVQRLADGTRWLQLPRALPVGWYVLTTSFAGIPRQAILQVTDTATFAMVTLNRTAVWVNDLATRATAPGATATLGGHALAGATDARGLLLATTPPSVRRPGVTMPLLVVRYHGRATFRPIGAGGMCGGCSGKGDELATPTVDPWWSLLTTDRSQYRMADTVNVLGVVRDRTSGSVPQSVKISLYASTDNGVASPSVQTATATPDRRGMYTVRLAISNLPVGSYRIRATTGSSQVAETWFEVASIRKPAYAVTVTTARHAVITGDAVATTVQAAFFEGTPVTGAAFRLQAGQPDETTGATGTAVTTGATGTATGQVTVTLEDATEQFGVVGVSGSPTLPEEADLSSGTQVAVFRGSAWISLDGTATSKKVVVTGGVNSVAFGRYEQAGVDPWNVDPRGTARPGAVVSVTTVANVAYLVKTGTAYDFVTKRVAPVYEQRTREVALPAHTVRTGADGTFRIVLAGRADADNYAVTATYTDEAGRQITTQAGISGTWREQNGNQPWLGSADGHGATQEYSVGDAIRVRFNGGVANPIVQRYLYLVTREGLRNATVGTSPSFRATFTAASVPSMTISAVRFNGSGYEVIGSGYRASLRLADRTLTVQVTPDRARYEPGDTATVTIRTLAPGGRPAAASVFVRAVDEKLYAIGAAGDIDPLDSLYAGLSDGVIGVAVSHIAPQQDQGGGGGDTTGGPGGTGGRADFRDWLLARIVTTGTDGRATVTIPLSDDLTSWHVAATALDASLDAGAGSALLPVGLPFFVDAVIAPEYLVTDRPIIGVRSYGTSLKAGNRVTFTVSSDTIPMAATTVTADAFGSAYVPLPALSAGVHRIRVAGTTGSGATALSDALVRTITVVAARATQTRTTWVALSGPTSIAAGSALTGVTLVDAGRGRVVPVLQELAVPDATRSDRALAAALANRVLVEQFGLPAVAQADDGGLAPFLDGAAVTVVPWGSAELEVTALAAMTGDPRLPTGVMASWLRDAINTPTETRARRLLALAGLAALGEPELGDIRAAAAQPDLTVEEQAFVALAALFAGDETLAGRFEQQVLAQHGLRSANLVRIDPGSGADATVVTARLAIVAASLDDPIAADMDAWVAANPPAATVVDLERVLAARGWARRVAGATATVALTVDGARREITIEPGAPVELGLTPDQAATARLEPLTGSTLVVQSWEDRLAPSSLHAQGGITMTRSTAPAGTIEGTATVIVTINVDLGSARLGECWRVVDIVPSGLAPIAAFGRLADENGNYGYDTPSRIDGQRVEFCAGYDTKRSAYAMRYVARVVTPGTYTWEPAVLQSMTDPSVGIVLEPTTVTISTPAG